MKNILIGLGVGAAAGLLLAPNSGRKTRARITDAATKRATYFKDRGEQVNGAIWGFIEQGKDEVARQKQGVAEAIKRGTHAYKRAVS
jgi:gas vesicle protein